MDPNVQNSGSFMSSAAGGANGAGPALQRLLALRNQGASPSPMNGNSQSPNAVPPAVPNTTSAIPAPVPGLAPSGAPSPMGTPQPQPQGQAPTPPSELSIALQALASYIASHGKALEAHHDVPLKTAQAKAMSASAQGGQ